MQKPSCFIILSPGFAANVQETDVLPFSQSFALSFKKCFPETKLIIIAFQFPLNASTYYWNGIEVIALGGKHKRMPLRIFTWINALIAIYKIKRKYAVTGILSFWLAECALVGQLATRLFGLKQYSWIMGQDAKPTNVLLKYLKLDKDRIISMSPNLVTKLNQSYPINDIRVIPQGIDKTYFDTVVPAETHYDILGVGSLIELKNYTLFVELVSRIKQSYPFIKTAIIGTGPQEKLLQQLVEKKGLQENIELVGLLPHASVIGYMKASDIFLHPSSYEGQSTVFLEALYCAMDVVCFDVGRLHVDENMYVCSNSDGMATVLHQLLASQKKVKKKVLARSMDDTVKEIMSLYG